MTGIPEDSKGTSTAPSPLRNAISCCRMNTTTNRREIRVRDADLDSMPVDFLKCHPEDAEAKLRSRTMPGITMQ
jgi:hypothetical protein